MEPGKRKELQIMLESHAHGAGLAVLPELENQD
jgi:hypothetical protein